MCSQRTRGTPANAGTPRVKEVRLVAATAIANRVAGRDVESEALRASGLAHCRFPESLGLSLGGRWNFKQFLDSRHYRSP